MKPHRQFELVTTLSPEECMRRIDAAVDTEPTGLIETQVPFGTAAFVAQIEDASFRVRRRIAWDEPPIAALTRMGADSESLPAAYYLFATLEPAGVGTRVVCRFGYLKGDQAIVYGILGMVLLVFLVIAPLQLLRKLWHEAGADTSPWIQIALDLLAIAILVWLVRGIARSYRGRMHSDAPVLMDFVVSRLEARVVERSA